MDYILIVGKTAYPVGVSPLSIGRSTDNDIVLPFPYISRRHAIVWTDGARLYVRDANSANGTWVNGRRLQGDAVLSADDHLRLGRV